LDETAYSACLRIFSTCLTFESVIRWLHVSGAKVHGAKKSQTKPGNQLWGLWVLARMMRVPVLGGELVKLAKVKEIFTVVFDESASLTNIPIAACGSIKRKI
jgi:hypothetical protein